MGPEMAMTEVKGLLRAEKLSASTVDAESGVNVLSRESEEAHRTARGKGAANDQQQSGKER